MRHLRRSRRLVISGNNPADRQCGAGVEDRGRQRCGGWPATSVARRGAAQHINELCGGSCPAEFFLIAPAADALSTTKGSETHGAECIDIRRGGRRGPSKHLRVEKLRSRLYEVTGDPHDLNDAEVAEQRSTAAAEQNVAGADVTVDETVCRDRAQGLCQRHRERDHLTGTETSSGSEQRGETAASCVVEDEDDVVVGVQNRPQSHHVWVADDSESRCFPAKSICRAGLARGPKPLQGDGFPGGAIAAEPHVCAAAEPDHLNDVIAWDRELAHGSRVSDQVQGTHNLVHRRRRLRSGDMRILATSGGFLSSDRGAFQWRRGPLIEHAIALAGDPARPKICHVGTAQGDSLNGIAGFYRAFAGSDARTSHLELFSMPNVADVRTHLLNQDVVWVGGGSVANLLAVWRVHDLDRIFRECWEEGVVLAGVSAGSICWHVGGPTDSFGLDLRVVTNGLALLPFGNGVHYDTEEQRRPLLHQLVRDGTLPTSYATDDGVGLSYRGTELEEVVADRPGVAAYRVERDDDGSVRETRIEPRLLSG